MRSWVLLVVRGRGRLVLRWEQAHSNPRRTRVPIEEQLRQHLTREVEAGRLTVDECGARYERFLRRHHLDAATDGRYSPSGNPEIP